MKGKRCKEVVVPSSLLEKVTQKSLVVHTCAGSDLAFFLFLGVGLS